MAQCLKNELLNEYVKKIKWVYMPLVKSGAFNRFDIKNGRIVRLSKSSVLYSFVVTSAVITCAYFVLQETAVKKKYLTLPEIISIFEYVVLNNVLLLNNILANRDSGAELITNFIEIDAFLGITQTKFMRDIIDKDVLIWSGFVVSFEVLLAVILISTFELPIYTYYIGFTLFFLELNVCYDFVFHVVFYKFLCLRVHYLNVVLVKMAKLNTDYLMDQLLSYPLHWKREYDDSVDSSSVDEKYCTEALKMIFEQLRRISKCYRFVVFSYTATVVISTFMAVEVIILYIKDPVEILYQLFVILFHKELPVIRTLALTAWFIVSWVLIIGITQQTDQFFVQMQRTKLICTYIQLTPNNSDDLFQLSRSILDVLTINDYRNSIYDLFYFDGNLIRSMASSVFIYITMQLQIAFPMRNQHDEGNFTLNIS